jgi:integrase
MPDSTPKSRTRKTARKHFVPPKPSKKFPLTPHASGKWMKKIRGKLHYFGNWARRINGELVRIEGDGCNEALALYKAQAEALHAGRTPRTASGDELTVKYLCNLFYTSKLRKMEAGELSPRSLLEYQEAVTLVAKAFGTTRLVDDLAAADFEKLKNTMAKKWGLVRRGKFIGIVRSIFLYALKNGLIERSVTFGTEFTKPKRKYIQKEKNAGGKKLFTAQEIQFVLNGRTIDGDKGKSTEVPGATPQMKAIILLGINAGLGNTDIGNLQFGHIDLESRWLDYPRVKTEQPRRVPLWKETIEAIQTGVANRPKAKHKDDNDCVFLNRGGRRMVQTHVSQTEDTMNAWSQDYISTAFGKLLQSMKINGRKGLNFYSLRHTFATVGLQTGDRDAVKSLMGHASHDILAAYDETGPNDDRLHAVVNHVHTWLFG